MPVRGNTHDWNAHTTQNVIDVLSEDGYIEPGKKPAQSYRKRLDEDPDRPFTVNIISPKGLMIGPDDPLRQVLTDIGKTHVVDVLAPGECGFMPWTGGSHDPGRILTIRIRRRADAQAA